MNDERLIDIETKLAFQEDIIQELNQVISRQQQQIDQLILQYRALAGRVASLPDVLAGMNKSGDEIPPHY
jgi:SlyX protein